MRTETELAIDQILELVVQCPIPLDWKSESPLPGAGERRSTYRGPGMDFMELDEFQDGDDPRNIDWFTTAKTGGRQLMKIVHQEEKEVRSYLLVDISDSMEFGTTRVTKRTLAAEMAASVIFSVDKTKDKVGLILYSAAGVLETMPSRSAMTHLYPIMSSILETNSLDTSRLMENPGNGLSKALSGLPNQRSLVFLISDFMNMTEQDWSDLEEAATMHDIICIYVQDRRERELPQLNGTGFFSGILGALGCFYTLEDHLGNREVIWNSASTRRKYSANFRAHEARVTGRLDQCGCQSMVVSTEEGLGAIPKVLNLFGSHC